MARLGTALLLLGLLACTFALSWQLGLAPGSRVTLPPPVALERAAPGIHEVGVATVEPTLISTPVAVVIPPPEVSAHTSPLVVADAAERAQRTPAESGYAVRLAIPAIKLDTEVEQGGIIQDAQGNPVWATLPFVAVHYGDLTSLIGAPGNAVIAGHVVTLSEGNVFRFLYQLDIDDQINVWDQRDHEHDFHVVEVRLVPPEDTSVMARTPDETLTLITCGGTFDPVKREFSDRLIVIAKPL